MTDEHEPHLYDAWAILDQACYDTGADEKNTPEENAAHICEMHAELLGLKNTTLSVELSITESFVQRVCERAESIMEQMHKLEGAHYAAMTRELERMREEADGDDGS